MKKVFSFLLFTFILARSFAAITITPTTVANGNIQHPYLQTLSASGGTKPYAWSISAGTQPTGLTLISSTNQTANLSGTPTTAGVYSFTVSVTDRNAVSATQGYTVTITQIVLTPAEITTIWNRGTPDYASNWDTWNSLTGTTGTNWSLTGNDGTTAGTNFVGTTSAADLVFKRNSAEVMRLYSSSNYVGIGTATPLALLHVASTHTVVNDNLLSGELFVKPTISGTVSDGAGHGAFGIVSSPLLTASVTAGSALYSLSGYSASPSSTSNISGSTGSLNISGYYSAPVFSGTVGASNTLRVAGFWVDNASNLGTTATTHKHGIYVSISGTSTNADGIIINGLSGGTNNKGINLNAPAASANNYALYSGATAQSYFAGSVGIGQLTPGASLDIISTGTTSATFALKTANSASVTIFNVRNDGSIITTTGINTTAGDDATIDAASGRFRKDASGTTFTLTNALITASSIVVLQYTTVGLTAGNCAVAVAGSGSAVITFQSAAGAAEAPNASADINFIVIN